MKRDDILSRAWTGEPLMLGGREITLTPVRYALLEYWKNSLFRPDESTQNAIAAMGELILVCYCEKSEIKELQRMSPEERHEKVMDFILLHEDEFTSVSSGIQKRLEALQASAVESEAKGKEEAQVRAF
jgi:hypothetical protein